MRRLLIGLLALVPAQSVSGPALPEGHVTQRYRTVRVDTPPVIGGDLRDPAGQQQADVLADLVQQIPEQARSGTDVDGRLTHQSRSLQTKLTYRWCW